MANYLLPIAFKRLTAGQHLPRISEEDSIRHHVYMILMTGMKEYRFNREYGCKIWENDFDISTTHSNWSNEVEHTLKETIEQHEPRIFADFRVDVRVVHTDEVDEKDHIRKIKQSFIITVRNLRLKNTNQAIDELEYSIIFSPISLD